MSKVKSAPEKKRNSLLKDRRNVYGESPTSSRKNIRKGKQRSHMALRRASAEELRSVKGVSNAVDGDLAEARAMERLAEQKLWAFKKEPDAPLAVVINRKQERRSPKQQEEDALPAYTRRDEWRRAEERLLRQIKQK